MNKSNIFIALLVIIIVVIWICSQKGYNQTNSNEQYVTPIYKELIIKKDISGKLYPEMEINAKSSVSGTLEEYYVQIGDMVKKGDRIAKVKVITNASQLEEANAQVENFRIQDEKLKKTYDRDNGFFGKAGDAFPTGATTYDGIQNFKISTIVERNKTISFNLRGGGEVIPLSLEQTKSEQKSSIKWMLNGQILIQRGEAIYDLSGKRIY